MAPRPKTIQIFLPDGDPQSVRIAEITSRTVQAVQVPRSVLGEVASHDELRQVGVYFLFGDAEEGELAPVYIGETQDGFSRLTQHHRDGSKDYWTQAIVITSRTNTFDKAQVAWLEWYCTQVAAEAERYDVLNLSAAQEPYVTKPIRADLLDHFDTLRVLVATLGFPVFRPAASPSESSAGQDMVTYSCTGVRASGRGRLTPEGFVVLEGSVARPDLVKSVRGTHVERTRDRMEASGVLGTVDGEYRFLRDYVFRSPSGAAIAVLGRTANGWQAWIDPEGRPLDVTRRQDGS